MLPWRTLKKRLAAAIHNTKEAKSMSGGRPSDYSPELAEVICTRLSEGESLIKICETEGMPTRATVYNWALRHPQFLDKYRHARDLQADSMIDDTQKIADSATPENWTVARLRVQTRQWAASKLAPKKYGTLQQVDMTVSKATVKRDPKTVEAARTADKAEFDKKFGINGAKPNGNGVAH